MHISLKPRMFPINHIDPEHKTFSHALNISNNNLNLILCQIFIQVQIIHFCLYFFNLRERNEIFIFQLLQILNAAIVFLYHFHALFDVVFVCALFQRFYVFCYFCVAFFYFLYYLHQFCGKYMGTFVVAGSRLSMQNGKAYMR